MTFKTRHQGLSAVLRYYLGAAAHTRTYLEPKGATFEFTDNGECRAIARQFFAEDGNSGFGVADAKALIDEFLAVRRTLSAAIENKEWKNEQCQPTV